MNLELRAIDLMVILNPSTCHVRVIPMALFYQGPECPNEIRPDNQTEDSNWRAAGSMPKLAATRSKDQWEHSDLHVHD